MAFAVLTTVQVRPGSVDELAALFDSTNRNLVAGHDDWLGAWFTANRAASEVTVSPDFAAAMAQFAKEFTGPPRVSVNEIMVEM